MARRDAEWREWFDAREAESRRREAESRRFMDEQIGDTRQFVRDLLLRYDKRQDERDHQLAERDRRLEASHERLIAHIDEMGEQVRANTQAVLSLLDRFGPEPNGA